MPALTVLSINGWCRNGSTILGNLLNGVDGFFHVGELHYLWKNAYGHGPHTTCGCGRGPARCPHWSRVLAAEHSWMRQKDYAHPMSAVRSTAYWIGFNLAARALIRAHPERSMVLRYEDFIAAPEATLRRLIELCGGDPARHPLRGRTAEL